MNKKAEASQTLSFKAEHNELLHLVTHSLYTHPEISIRELISNASDANNKMRLEVLRGKQVYGDDSTLKIQVYFDKEARTITVRDNGIGMSRAELIKNLGTIALSGTKRFLKQLSGNQTKDSQLIGQFGVGFYSTFLIADKVTLKTRAAGLDASEGVSWESKGKGEYSVTSVKKETRGTEVILHLKKDADMFLDDWKLRTTINKYSDHIIWPIMMKEPVLESGDDEKGGDPKQAQAGVEEKEQVVNQHKALWRQAKKDITDEDYQAFYKHISGDFSPALTWSHNLVEGKLEYVSLLYIPEKAPVDLWNMKQRKNIKLYVQRTFILEDADQFLPGYLRFVTGIIDCNDLPLNVSRELLQDNKIVNTIRSACVKRILGLLEALAKKEPEKYIQFWKAFGQVLKEGPAEDFNNRDRVGKLLRFASTHDSEEVQRVSLADYLSRMKPKQDKIYYLTSDSFLAAKKSPHLEIFKQRGIEVLLLHDRIDEWLVTHLSEFEGKQLQSIAKGKLDLSDLTPDVKEDKQASEVKAKQTKLKDELSGILSQMKTILDGQVKEVRFTDRLIDSPSCITVAQDDMSVQLNRLLKQAGQPVPESAPILELNPQHIIIQNLHAEQDEKRFAQWTKLLYSQAQLAEGGQLNDPSGFVHVMNQLISQFIKTPSQK